MLPDGVPSLLKLNQAAQVLNLAERTVKGWLERGVLPYVQPSGRKGARLIPSADLADFAARFGLALDWERAL
ncbi:helix-turn-helix domain-containing protein [Deinococcus alpinitundrae]|uniref:helix-turn-helix domain-containing protein n=1 Tax=Deinococcus alpinitundrae TaxID=468913 RepID=UPI00137B44E4|nr:helix-turn-helix domain-containing protein [Deinococcus alpinitundrae]